DWTEFIEWDWVISRQNIYGTPIPFWHCGKCGKTYEAKKEDLPVDPALEKFKGAKQCECGGEIIGETAVCDCWVDSSITPLIISGWEDGDAGKRKLFNKVYPISLRPQGLEIIRTWAFYTIFRSLVLTGEPCFKDVLINGNVLGTDGKKMSKSAGNFEDPNILFAKYSADAIRQWAALSGAFAKDRPFNYKDIEYAQGFLNKLWNAGKFVQASTPDYDGKKVEYADLRATDKWILSRLNQLVKKASLAMNEYDYYSAITAIHSFVWHELCDYYLEDVKYRIYGSDAKSKKAAQYALKTTMLASLKLLAPFAPFVADEIYRELSGKSGSIHESEWPGAEEEFINESVENICAQLHSILSKVRKFKATNQIALNEELESSQLPAKESFIKELPSIEEEIRQVGKIKLIEPKEDADAQEAIVELKMA
ncbi:class I tRNA ligase family protein, partial [Candidatus Micrarchaeota archaeon]|nr:class I tRNA ligase family protein [Candidatus Micrarchaeota archaeon]